MYYLVLIPHAPGQRIATTVQDGYQIYEVDESLVIPVKSRPQMPTIAQYQNCMVKEDAIRIAKNERTKMIEMDTNLFCLKCETNIVNDVGNWLVCYCTGREGKEPGLDDYPDYWVNQETVEPYDTLEEKWL